MDAYFYDFGGPITQQGSAHKLSFRALAQYLICLNRLGEL